MSIEMGATEVTKAVSEVNIPEVADKSTDTGHLGC